MVLKQDSIQKISKFIMEDVIHMRALVYRGNGELALEDRPVPVLQDERDAIVEVTLTPSVPVTFISGAARCPGQYRGRFWGMNLWEEWCRPETL